MNPATDGRVDAGSLRVPHRNFKVSFHGVRRADRTFCDKNSDDAFEKQRIPIGRVRKVSRPAYRAEPCPRLTSTNRRTSRSLRPRIGIDRALRGDLPDGRAQRVTSAAPRHRDRLRRSGLARLSAQRAKKRKSASDASSASCKSSRTISIGREWAPSLRKLVTASKSRKRASLGSSLSVGGRAERPTARVADPE